ncbi:hypothetical protein BDV19DRAFT_386605 [Aspergillus venezuelensis]
MAHSEQFLNVVVGLDFGTTFTKLSFRSVIATSTTNPNFLRGWPSGRDDETVPSPGIPDNTEVSAWIKLLLDDEIRQARCQDPTLAELDRNGVFRLPHRRSAEVVVGDFLRHVYNKIRNDVPSAVDSTLGSVAFQFHFTYPVVWSDQTKNSFQRAIILAGFTTRPQDSFFSLTEGEAAAHAMIKAIDGQSMDEVKGLLVRDCGGGTVDLASYYVAHASGRRYTVVVVGELSQSPYLRRRISNSGIEKHGIRAIYHPKPHLAVAAGAVLRGLETTFASTLPFPSSYVFAITRPHEDGDDEAFVCKHPVSQRKMTGNVMCWAVYKVYEEFFAHPFAAPLAVKLPPVAFWGLMLIHIFDRAKRRGLAFDLCGKPG